MTTETSIFNPEVTPPVVAPVTPPQAPVLPPEVAELVGQGKKYATVDDAIKSVPHAQKHIQTLEQELAQTKAELLKRQTTEELLNDLKANGIPPVVTQSAPTINSEQISALVRQELSQQEAQAVATQNTKKVTDAFVSKFGDKAEEIFNKVATESGLTVGNLNFLAATSPSAVLKLAGIAPQQTPPIAKTTSSFNTQVSSSQPEPPSARVKQGASTKDLVNAWKIAGQKVGREYS